MTDSFVAEVVSRVVNRPVGWQLRVVPIIAIVLATPGVYTQEKAVRTALEWLYAVSGGNDAIALGIVLTWLSLIVASQLRRVGESLVSPEFRTRRQR